MEVCVKFVRENGHPFMLEVTNIFRYEALPIVSWPSN